MKIAPRDVVAAYKALRAMVEKSNFHTKEAFLLFFMQRISIFCSVEGLVTTEEHKKYLGVFFNMVADFDKNIAESYAVMAKTRAESTGSDGDEAVDVGYFSILSYSFTFLLNHQNDYVNYASDRYLGSIESYLIDGNESELDNEITNIELLTEAAAVLEARRDSDGLSLFGAWAVSVPVGQKLPDFSW